MNYTIKIIIWSNFGGGFVSLILVLRNFFRYRNFQNLTSITENDSVELAFIQARQADAFGDIKFFALFLILFLVSACCGIYLNRNTKLEQEIG